MPGGDSQITNGAGMAAETQLQSQDIAALKARLADECKRLKKEINEELARDDLSKYTSVIDAVRDRGEESVADLYSDLELQLVERHVQRLWAIERALERTQGHVYGICQDCAQPISKPRLEADPAAARCVGCQTKVENVPSAKDLTPSL